MELVTNGAFISLYWW